MPSNRPSKAKAKTELRAKRAKRGRPFARGLDSRRGPGGRGPEKGAPNAGRPPSAFLRAMLIADIWERIDVLERIADGEPTVRTRMSIEQLLELSRPQLAAALGCSPDALSIKPGCELSEIEVLQSAPPRDRIRALEFFAKYGLGPVPQIIKGKITNPGDVAVIITRDDRR
jgi:hypothetical protein